MRLPGYQPTTEGNSKQIRLAAKALANARRPVLYAGGGVISAGASAELTELATSDRFPVTCTLMGLGAFPAPHAQWLGMLGMHGTRAANYAMDEADLIVAIGARFDDRITGKLSEFAPRAKFIHIDVDPAEISKNVPAHIPIVGDAKNILQRLVTEYRAHRRRRRAAGRVVGAHRGLARPAPAALRRLRGHRDQAAVPDRGALRGHGRRGDRLLRRRPAPDVDGAVLPLRQAAPLDQLGRARARWASACPAGMGAAVARPDVPTIVITGDGSIQMNTQELATCTEHRIPVKVFIANNGYLGMVRQWQELFWDKRYSQVDMGQWPDFVKLAEAYGATGMRLTDKTTLVADIKTALETDGPGRGRRPRHARGEHLPDDPGRRRRARDGGLTAWASQGPRSRSPSRSSRRPPACGRAASTSSRSWWRTSRAS